MAKNKSSLILFTGGHFSAAQAVLSEMQSRGYTNFLWVGSKFNQKNSNEPSLEFNEIDKLKIPFIDLQTGKLVRNWKSDPVGALTNLVMIPAGFIKALVIVAQHKPALVVSFGGYLALPIVVFAKLFGAKIITHEQTAVAGLANRMIAKFANKVMVSWPASLSYYPAAKTELTGNPIRPEVFAVKSNTFDFPNDLPIVCVVGGNQGSHVINQALFAKLPELLKYCNIIHQTGNSTATHDADKAIQMKVELAGDLQSHYLPKPQIMSDEIGEMFTKSVLAISRAGANFTYELLAWGKPTIFIPIPWVSHNEQYHQAKLAEDIGIGHIITESELTPELLFDAITGSLELISKDKAFNGHDLQKVEQEAKNTVKLNAAKSITDIAESYLQ